MTLLLLLEMVVSAFAERIAVGTAHRHLTYRQLLDAAGAGAAELRRRGVRHLVYVGQGDLAFPVALYAAAWAGVPLVPLNYRLSDEQLTELLDQLRDLDADGDPLVVTDDPDRLDHLAGHVLSLDDWVALTTTAGGRGGDDLDVEPSTTDGEDVAALLFTSGTTSTPKAVVLRHRHITSYVVTSIELGAADEGDAALITVPPYHVAGVANVVTSTYAARRIVELPAFTPAAWLDAVRSEGITNAMLVPTMLARVVEHLGGAPADCPTLRSLAYGGARMPISVLERALAAFPDAGFVNAYGLTETSSTLAVLGPDDHRAARDGDPEAWRRLGSAGKLVPGIEVDVRDGELWVRGEQVSGEYLGRASSLDDAGWFPTRDRGWVDEDGYLFIEGRADDTIIRGGENIAPAEVEDVLLAHPAVLEAAVVGVPDEEWGQRLAAAVVLRPGAVATPDELRDHAREHLRSSKTPDVIALRDELPHTATGKLLRRQVLDDVVHEIDGEGARR